MQTWPRLQSSSVKTVSIPWTKGMIESRRIMSDDILDVGLNTNKWPGYLKTKMLKNDYENLTFLNSSSISIRDLLLRTRIGSHTLYISFESYKGHRSASGEERYHFKEGKSEIGMRALSVIPLTQTSSSPPQYHLIKTYWFRNSKGTN